MHETQAVNLSEATQTWLNERRRPGNWIAIGASDDIPTDIIGWSRTFLHMFQLAFAPEIERRINAGALDQNFYLYAAQYLVHDERKTVVRLNQEVRGIAIAEANATSAAEGKVLISDIERIVSFDVEEAELDCGHFTMYWTKTGWNVCFNFLTFRAKSIQIISAARQFLSAARIAATAALVRPSIDNLFSACELFSKARLILHDSRASKAKTHGSIGSAINAWGRLGNVNEDFLKLYNRMAQARAPARYDAAAMPALPTEADFLLLEQELDRLERQIAHRTHDALPSPV